MLPDPYVRTDLADSSETHTFLGKTPLQGTTAAPLYDADGNTLRDERWLYTWDGENRLVGLATRTEATTAGTPNITLTYRYDAQHRRIFAKTENAPSTGTSEAATTVRTAFFYNGWNVIAEYTSNAATGPLYLTASNLWGLDLSGTLQGAGGVGGLLYRNRWSADNTYTWLGDAVPVYDGNGNVIKALTSNAAQDYEYGPFGEAARATAAGESFPYRWCTKYSNSEDGLAHYGYRYFRPHLGVWLNRDPMQEAGGSNLYAMSMGDPINLLDPLGLAPSIVEYVRALEFTFNAQHVAIGGGTANIHFRPRLGYYRCLDDVGNNDVEATIYWHETSTFDPVSQSGRILTQAHPGIASGADYDMVHANNGQDWKNNTTTGPWLQRRFVTSGHSDFDDSQPAKAIIDNWREIAGDDLSTKWVIELRSSDAAMATLKGKEYHKGFRVEAEVSGKSTLKLFNHNTQHEEHGKVRWKYIEWELLDNSKTRIIKQDASKQ